MKINSTNKKISFFSTILVLTFCINTYAQTRSSKSNQINRSLQKNSSKVLTSPAAINETVISCGPFTWPLTGQTFTSSGTFTSNGITQSFNNLADWNTNVTNFNATIATNNLGGITNTNPIPLTVGSTSVSMGAPNGMYTTSTFVSLNTATDVLTITLSPGVYGFGANIFASDISDALITGDITVTYSTGFIDTRTVTSANEFFGYTSTVPITSITITCSNSGSPFKWPSIKNLSLATNPLATLDLTVQTPPVTEDYSVCQGASVSGGLISNLNNVIALPNFSGNTTGGPIYNRPQVMNQGGTCLNSGVGTAVPFSSHTFTAPTSGAYEFSSCGGATFDTFLALYEGTFNPSGLCAGNTLVESNDDVCGAQSTITCNLVAGTSYTLVFSGFGNTDFGAYTVTSTTPGTTAVVPVPNFVGNTTSGATYNRAQAMNQGGTCANSGVGTAVPFSSHTFIAPRDGAYEFSTCGGATFDTFLALYEGTFNPSGLCAGNTLVESSDDVCGAQSTITCTLIAGTSYTLVVSGFANTDAGPYTITSTTPGLLALVEWYTAPTGGIMIGSGSPFNPVGVTGSGLANTNTVGTTTFYAQFPGEICRTPADFIINESPIINCPANITACEGDAVNFTVTSNVSGNISLTQNTSSIAAVGSVSCNPGGDNAYYRVYDLTALGYTNNLILNNIKFSVESTAVDRLVTVNAYTLTGALTNANLTLLGSNTITALASAPSFTNYTVSMGGLTVPAGSKLVISYSVPSSTNNIFLPGSNALGQSAPAFIKAIACGILEPTSLSSIGFPNVHIIIDAELTDNESLLQTTGLPSGSVFPVGTTTVTYLATNSEGCEASCSFDVVVNAISSTPTGNSVQTFSVSDINDATIADLVVSPTTVIWYPTLSDAQAETNALPLSTTLTSGSSYFAVNNSGTCPSLPFEVNATVTLGINDFEDSSFSYFPNPTASILNINSSEPISTVRVFNLLGQEIKHQNFNSNALQIDLSDLSDGTYLVKIDFNGKEKTIKIIKKQ